MNKYHSHRPHGIRPKQQVVIRPRCPLTGILIVGDGVYIVVIKVSDEEASRPPVGMLYANPNVASDWSGEQLDRKLREIGYVRR